MRDQPSSISKAFQIFMADASGHAQAWGGMVQGLASASALDGKTAALAYLAVLAALRLESGVPFHVQQAKQRGASRDEVIRAILVGLPAVGHGVTQVLPAAIAAYDARSVVEDFPLTRVSTGPTWVLPPMRAQRVAA